MFFRSDKSTTIRSLISEGTVLEGDIVYAEGLRIDGKVKGSVRSDPKHNGILIIGDAAVVEGEIHAHHVIVNGTIKGPIRVDHLLELQPKAKILGDVHYHALEMHNGAQVTGQLNPISKTNLKVVAATPGTMQSGVPEKSASPSPEGTTPFKGA